MREKELEQRQMEMAKILTALQEQEEKLQGIFQAQKNNTSELEALHTAEELDVMQIEGHRNFGIKPVIDAQNQERIITHTKAILQRKQQEVKERENSRQSHQHKNDRGAR